MGGNEISSFVHVIVYRVISFNNTIQSMDLSYDLRMKPRSLSKICPLKKYFTPCALLVFTREYMTCVICICSGKNGPSENCRDYLLYHINFLLWGGTFLQPKLTKSHVELKPLLKQKLIKILFNIQSRFSFRLITLIEKKQN